MLAGIRAEAQALEQGVPSAPVQLATAVGTLSGVDSAAKEEEEVVVVVVVAIAATAGVVVVAAAAVVVGVGVV